LDPSKNGVNDIWAIEIRTGDNEDDIQENAEVELEIRHFDFWSKIENFE